MTVLLLPLPPPRKGLPLSLDAALALVALHHRPGPWHDEAALEELRAQKLIRSAWGAWSLTEPGIEQVGRIPRAYRQALLAEANRRRP